MFQNGGCDVLFWQVGLPVSFARYRAFGFIQTSCQLLLIFGKDLEKAILSRCCFFNLKNGASVWTTDMDTSSNIFTKSSQLFHRWLLKISSPLWIWKALTLGWKWMLRKIVVTPSNRQMDQNGTIDTRTFKKVNKFVYLASQLITGRDKATKKSNSFCRVKQKFKHFFYYFDWIETADITAWWNQ